MVADRQKTNAMRSAASGHVPPPPRAVVGPDRASGEVEAKSGRRLRAAPTWAGAGGVGPDALSRGHRPAQRLHEVSKLLLHFEGPERTAPAIFAIVTETLRLRSAVLLYEEGGRLHSLTWRAEAAGAVELRLAEMHARRVYAYLAGPDAALDVRGVSPGAARELPAPSRPGRAAKRPHAADDVESLVALPLVAGGPGAAGGPGRVFGALQVGVGGRLDEAGLFFVRAVVEQLAAALARHARLAAERAADEARARAAERRLAAAERARAEAEAMRDQYEAQLGFCRAVSDSLGEGVVAVDLGGRITFFNPAAEQLLGWAEAEALGEPVRDLLEVRRPGGDALAPDACPLRRALRTGEPARGDEISFAGRDRRPFPASYTSTPLRRAGRVTGAVLVFRDVLALKRSENAQHFLAEVSAALAASLDYRDTVAAVARLAVPFLADLCCVDEVGEGGAVKRTEVAFADEARAADALRRLGPDREAASTPPARAALRTGRAVLAPGPFAPPASGPGGGAGDEGSAGGEAGLLRALGVGSMMAVPLRARGRTLGVLSFASLESGRRYSPADLAFAEELAHRAATALDNARLHQEARRAVEQRQDILAIVSHDLRTPLGAILMGTAVLSEHAPAGESGAPQRRALDLVARSVARMDRLIKDLLDMSSIDAGHLSLDKRPHALGPLVEDAVETQRPLAARKSLRLDVRAPADELSLPCDRWRVVQVLSNLLGNAIKFTAEGGAITVGAERRGAFARVSVADTGAGIAPERLPHVFERYWQAKETASKGTGLGLYISKGIVEAHGGTMSVESQVGRGTTFCFTLPLHPPDEGDEGTTRPPAVAAADHARFVADVAEPPRSSERPPPPTSLSWPPPHAFPRR